MWMSPTGAVRSGQRDKKEWSPGLQWVPENLTSPGKDQFTARDSSPPARNAEEGTTNMEDRQGWTLIGAP